MSLPLLVSKPQIPPVSLATDSQGQLEILGSYPPAPREVTYTTKRGVWGMLNEVIQTLGKVPRGDYGIPYFPLAYFSFLKVLFSYFQNLFTLFLSYSVLLL